MIIGFDGSRAFTANRTGTENYSYHLLKTLAKIDKKNKYIVYLSSLSNLGYLGYLQKQKNFHFEVIDWPRFWTQGGLALQTFIDKLDVLFVPAHTLPLIRKPGLKTVVTVHDLGSEYLPTMHQLKQRLYLRLMQNYQLKTATRIIAVSNATKQDLVKRIGINPENIKVIYEGYDENLFKPVKAEILRNRLKYFDIKKNSYFLFVGTVQPRKNLERVIKAFAAVILSGAQRNEGSVANATSSNKLRDSSQARNDILVIAGSKGWLSDEIYKLPKKLGIEDRVKFLGYVPDKDLPALYSGAIAFVYPSLFEGFGLPILDAQACGCPVITSNVSSMPEVACLPAPQRGEPAGRAGEGAILVDPYSVEDIVESMNRIKNHESRIKLIKEGFENIKRFSWEKCARETLQILLNLESN